MPSLRSAARKPRPRPAVQFEDGNQLNSTLGVVVVYNIIGAVDPDLGVIVVVFDRPLQDVSTDAACFTIVNDAGDEFESSYFGVMQNEPYRAYRLYCDMSVVGFITGLRVSGPPNAITGIDGSTLPAELFIPLNGTLNVSE